MNRERIKFSIKTITPELAEKLLLGEQINRPISQDNINAYVKEINKGQGHE